MTNVTETQQADGSTLLKWAYSQLAMPMESNVQGPWERFPTVKEVFLYNPFNGTLKMDIILDNFTSRNSASRIFLSYGIKYLHLQPGNATLTISADHQDFQLTQLSKVHPTSSTLIVVKVDEVERAFFDFGGNITLDDIQEVSVTGSIGPPDLYWLNERNVWLAIGLNYTHVNRTLVHDPYFGFSKPPFTTDLHGPPFTWTLATAAAGIAVLVGVFHNYRKTKALFRISNK